LFSTDFYQVNPSLFLAILVPTTLNQGAMKTILVPFDFSEYALAALQSAKKIAAKASVQLISVTVIPSQIDWDLLPEKARKNYPDLQLEFDEASTRIPEYLKMMSFSKNEVQVVVKIGVPAEQIVRSEGPRNTAEEAIAMGKIARERGWTSLLLVTSATHLPRATATFRHLSGLKIVPVACDFQLAARHQSGQTTGESLLLDLLPQAGALATTTSSLKELLGLFVYRLKGWL
jgi:uncharacterized SAM-binding protein YcdF (DUF218 family)